MIVLSSEELLAMNGLIDGAPIDGIQLNASDEPEENRLIKLKESLTEKGFLTNNELNDKFMVTAKLLKLYKLSDHKVYINNLRIALVENDYAIVLDVLPSHEVSFSRVPRITIIKKYIEAAEFLRKGQKAKFFDYDKESFSEAEFEEELDSKEWDNFMVVQTHKKKALTIFKAYYFDDQEAHCYDYIKKVKQQRGAKDFRMDLLDILEINIGGE